MRDGNSPRPPTHRLRPRIGVRRPASTYTGKPPPETCQPLVLGSMQGTPHAPGQDIIISGISPPVNKRPMARCQFPLAHDSRPSPRLAWDPGDPSQIAPPGSFRVGAPLPHVSSCRILSVSGLHSHLSLPYPLIILLPNFNIYFFFLPKLAYPLPERMHTGSFFPCLPGAAPAPRPARMAPLGQQQAGREATPPDASRGRGR